MKVGVKMILNLTRAVHGGRLVILRYNFSHSQQNYKGKHYYSSTQLFSVASGYGASS